MQICFLTFYKGEGWQLIQLAIREEDKEDDEEEIQIYSKCVSAFVN